MRRLATTILALGTLAGASTTSVLAAAAPGPGTKAALPDTSQVEKVGHFGHHHGGFGRGFGRFGGIGFYGGPGWGYYGGPYYGYSNSYYLDDDDYYDDSPVYYVPRYRYRTFTHRRAYGHRHYQRHRH